MTNLIRVSSTQLGARAAQDVSVYKKKVTIDNGAPILNKAITDVGSLPLQ
jgi:hypothetical protein